jgi:hypothetical protein
MFKQILFNNSKTRFALFLLSISTLLIVNSGCRTVLSGIVKTNFLEGNAAQDISAAVKEKFGDKVRVLAIEIEEREFEIKVQDPKNPQNIDLYKYMAGSLVKSDAVRLNGLERNLNNTLFDFNSIDLSAVPLLTEQIQKRAQLKDGKIRKIEIKRGLTLTSDFEHSGDVRWIIEFSNDRESVTAVADAKGQLLGVDLSQTSQAGKFNMFDQQELKQAGEALRSAFGDKALYCEISINEKLMMIEKPEMDDPDSTHSYIYDISGLKQQITGVSMRVESQKLFSLEEINLADAGRLSQIALQELPGAQSNVSGITIEKDDGFKEIGDGIFQTVWKVRVSYTKNIGGKGGWVAFDTKGNVLKVVK